MAKARKQPVSNNKMARSSQSIDGSLHRSLDKDIYWWNLPNKPYTSKHHHQTLLQEMPPKQSFQWPWPEPPNDTSSQRSNFDSDPSPPSSQPECESRWTRLKNVLGFGKKEYPVYRNKRMEMERRKKRYREEDVQPKEKTSWRQKWERLTEKKWLKKA